MGKYLVESPSPRSGRQHKGLGRQPQDPESECVEPAERATAVRESFLCSISGYDREICSANGNQQTCRPPRGLGNSCALFPGAHAQGFMLSRAPRALIRFAKLGELTMSLPLIAV